MNLNALPAKTAEPVIKQPTCIVFALVFNKRTMTKDVLNSTLF